MSDRERDCGREPKYGCHDCAFTTEFASLAVEHGARDGHQVFYLRNPDASEFGWLIELGSDPPRYWEGFDAGSFTANAFGALRFARAVDAQRAIAWLVEKGANSGCKAVEHGFQVKS